MTVEQLIIHHNELAEKWKVYTENGRWHIPQDKMAKLHTLDLILLGKLQERHREKDPTFQPAGYTGRNGRNRKAPKRGR